MADSLALAVLIDVRLNVCDADVEVLLQEAQHTGPRHRSVQRRPLVHVVMHGEQLHAVAGGEDERLADAGLVRESARRISKASNGDCQALAHLHRRRERRCWTGTPPGGRAGLTGGG